MINRILSEESAPTDQEELLPPVAFRVNRSGTVLEIVADLERPPRPPVTLLAERPYRELLPGDLVDEALALIRTALDEGKLINTVLRFDWEGRQFHIDVHIVPDGTEEALVVASDQSVRHRREEATRRLNRALLSLQSAASAVTLSLSVEHVLDTFSWEVTDLLDAAGCAVYGYEADAESLSLLSVYQMDGGAHGTGSFQPQLAARKLIWNILSERYARQVSLADINQPLLDPEFARSGRVESLLLMPLVFQDKTLGLVAVFGRGAGHSFSEQEISLAQLLTNQAAAAVANAQSHEETARQLQAQTVLREASQSFTATLDRQKVVSNIAEQLCRTVNATSAHIRTFESDIGASVVAAEFVSEAATQRERQPMLGTSAEHGAELGALLSVGTPLVWQVREGQMPVNEFVRLRRSGCKTALILPMLRGGRLIAFAEVWESRRERAFSDHELLLANGITQLATVALENAGLYQRARREIAERQRAEAELESERTSLAQRVSEQTSELRRANAELARAARLKDEFLASMSHELRTPLNAILGIAEGMTDQLYGPLNERQTRSLTLVEQSGRHLLSLIDDILDVSKIESGQLSLDMALVPINSTVQSCLQLVKQAAGDKNIRVIFRNESEATHLRADGKRLKQILINLLSNAVKFTPENGTVGLDVISEFDENTIRFVVWDTGIGIRESDLPRLFQPFVQLDSSLARRYNGTGLGLALVKRLTEMHGGTVEVASAPGEGSRFTVSIPWRQMQSDDWVEPVSRSAALAGTRTLTDPAKGPAPLILLAEDDPINAEVFVSCIRSMDMRVKLARDGAEALALLADERPDLILMDIQMPNKSGLDAIRDIRQREDFESVPIIALTALAMAGDREKCLEAGANDYISKPIPLRQLRRVIRAHLADQPAKGRSEGDVVDGL